MGYHELPARVELWSGIKILGMGKVVRRGWAVRSTGVVSKSEGKMGDWI